MEYEKLVNDILLNIGGADNINKLTHCATRLRFQLLDGKKADLENLSKLEGAIDAIKAQDEIQIIIGTDVPFVYKEIMEITKLDENKNKNMNKEKNDDDNSLIGKIFALISATFTPLMAPIIGAGMIKAITLILGDIGLIETTSGTYALLTAAGNAIFYFLPIFMGITFAKKLGANPYMGGTIGAVLLDPNFTILYTENADVSFLGIPIMLLDYASSIIPIFGAVTLLYFLEKWLEKVIHKNLRMIFVPTISLIIVVPLTVLIFGPFGIFLGNFMTIVVNWLSSTSSILFGAVMGACNVFIILSGIGWAFLPIALLNLAAGGDPIMMSEAAFNFAAFGVSFGFYLKTKDKALKSLAAGTTLTGLLAGISEPILYGMILRYRKTLAMLMIAGGVGGAFMGAFNVKGISFAFTNVFTVASFEPIIPYIIGILISFVTGAALVVIFGYESNKNEKDKIIDEINYNEGE